MYVWRAPASAAAPGVQPACASDVREAARAAHTIIKRARIRNPEKIRVSGPGNPNLRAIRRFWGCANSFLSAEAMMELKRISAPRNRTGLPPHRRARGMLCVSRGGARGLVKSELAPPESRTGRAGPARRCPASSDGQVRWKIEGVPEAGDARLPLPARRSTGGRS